MAPAAGKRKAGNGSAPAAETTEDRINRVLQRAHETFVGNHGEVQEGLESLGKVRVNVKIGDEYALVKDMEPASTARPAKRAAKDSAPAPSKKAEAAPVQVEEVEDSGKTEERPMTAKEKVIAKYSVGGTGDADMFKKATTSEKRAGAIALYKKPAAEMPSWHAPWKLMRVISGHNGWVRCIAVEPGNQWFVTGAADRTIKIWDLASGQLKLTLTGHISTIRGLVVSERHPYLFSVSEDKKVLCWDLEQNKVTRHYHGHLSGVYSVALHPTIDVLVTGGRDSSARVWDMRTKNCVHVLTGHTNTVAGIGCQSHEPQVITASHDSTVRLWDLAAGKTMSTLTNHKKSIRSLFIHPSEYTFSTASSDNVKVWKCPKGEFLRNINHDVGIINAHTINRDGVMVTGSDNGRLGFWDWKTGYNFYSHETVAQPGSLDSEAGIFDLKYDLTGSRLITAEADKSIKIYKEDDSATPDSHPIDFTPERKARRY